MPRTRARAVTPALFVLLLAACVSPEPILVEGGTIVVENRSAREWRDVRVIVNDHFFGGAPRVPAGGRLDAPLGQFKTGFGQPFERSRMTVDKVEVTATDADGNPVALSWDRKKRRGET